MEKDCAPSEVFIPNRAVRLGALNWDIYMIVPSVVTVTIVKGLRAFENEIFIPNRIDCLGALQGGNSVFHQHLTHTIMAIKKEQQSLSFFLII